LLGKENGGADCLLDDENLYLQKPTEQYPKPSLQLANYDEDILILNPITQEMPSRERPILASPRVQEVVQAFNQRKLRKQSNESRKQQT